MSWRGRQGRRRGPRSARRVADSVSSSSSPAAERAAGDGGPTSMHPPAFARAQAKRGALAARVARAQARLQSALSGSGTTTVQAAVATSSGALAVPTVATGGGDGSSDGGRGGSGTLQARVRDRAEHVSTVLTRAELEVLSPRSQHQYVASLGKAELTKLLGGRDHGSARKKNKRRKTEQPAAVSPSPAAGDDRAPTIQVVTLPGLPPSAASGGPNDNEQAAAQVVEAPVTVSNLCHRGMAAEAVRSVRSDSLTQAGFCRRLTFRWMSSTA